MAREQESGAHSTLPLAASRQHVEQVLGWITEGKTHKDEPDQDFQKGSMFQGNAVQQGIAPQRLKI